MELMELKCKSCDSEIASKDVNVDLAIAKCGKCGAMFSLRGAGAKGGERDEPAEREQVAMPKGTEIKRNRSGLQIRWRWFGMKYVGAAVFCVMWNGFMVVWMGMALRDGKTAMALFGSIHALVGLGILYYTLAGFFNRTNLRVNKKRLTIKHGPIPAARNRDMRADQIRQIFCKEKIHRNRNSTHYSYEVHVILPGHKREKLVGGLDRIEQAMYLEQELEEFLEIEDRKVSGEVKR